MWDKNDKHLDVLQNIESCLVIEYKNNPNLTDGMVIMAVNKGVVAINQKFGFNMNRSCKGDNESEDKIINGIREIGEMSQLQVRD